MKDRQNNRCTGVILAGGLNKRFNGQQKALLRVDGKPIVEHIYLKLSSLFQDVIIVANIPENYLQFDAQIVTDILAVQSPLTGIHTGLSYAQTPYIFVTACDTPFLKPEIIQFILDQNTDDRDVYIPKTTPGFEPLCAVYSKSCLRPIAHFLGKGQLKILNFFKKMKVKYIKETELQKIDPELISFFNINTPQDLETAVNKQYFSI